MTLERHLISSLYDCNGNSDCNFYSLRVSDGEKWTCEQGHDLQKRTIHSGTWLANSNLTLAESLKLMYMWSHQHLQEEAQHEARVGNNATVRWYFEHRKACVTWLLSKEDKIEGKGHIVEIDESKFGKCKYNGGHRVDGSWVSFSFQTHIYDHHDTHSISVSLQVLGGIERHGNQGSFIVVVETCDTATLLPIIKSTLFQAASCLTAGRHMTAWSSMGTSTSVSTTARTSRTQ